MRVDFLRWAGIAIVAIGIVTAGGALAQTVTYSFGTTSDLLDASFYAGEASDGSDVSGRLVMNVGINGAGTEAIFWAVNIATFQQGLFRVPIGQPLGWERLLPDQGFDYDQISWTPDDDAVLFAASRYTVSTQVLEIGRTLHGYLLVDGTVTRNATDNYYVAGANVGIPDNNELVAVPILPNGDEDLSRDPAIITNFGFTRPVGNAPLVLPWLSNDGSAVAFVVFDSSTDPDLGDVYLLENLDQILAAPKIGITDISSLAPTSLSDPNVIDIRASDSANFVSNPSLSQDGSIVFYSEDYNNEFDLEDFFPSASLGDFDLNLAQRDGTGDVRFVQPLNQSIPAPFPTGNRMTFGRAVNDELDFRTYITTLSAQNNIAAETDDLPEGETSAVIDGQTVNLPFELTDSAVQATSDFTVADASGTAIQIPTDQVINFPPGSSPQITIFTPINPVADVQLPNPQTDIPVLRTFGPSGTQFFPPITVTITYTDAEVANIANEAEMIPYLFVGGAFVQLEAEFLATVVVDVDANTLTFQTDHFSTYGIGGLSVEGLASLPHRGWMYVSLFAVLGLAGAVLVRRMRFVPSN